MKRKERPRVKINFRHGFWDVGAPDANGDYTEVPNPVEPGCRGDANVVEAYGIRGLIVYKGEADDVCYWEVCEDPCDLHGTLFGSRAEAIRAFAQEFRDYLLFEIAYRRQQMGMYRD